MILSERLGNEVRDRVVSTIDVPVLVVNESFEVLGFTYAAAELMGINQSHVDRPIAEVGWCISASDLTQMLKESVDTGRKVDVKCRDGRWYSFGLSTISPPDTGSKVVVITITNIDDRKKAEMLVEDSATYFQSIVETVREPLIILDENLVVKTANRSFYQTFQVSPVETEGRFIYDLGDGQWNIPELRTLLEDILPRSIQFNDFQVEHDFPIIGKKIMLLNARQVYRQANHTKLILLAIEDATERITAKNTMQEAYERERHIADVLQRSLISDVDMDLPENGIVARYRPALEEAEVGGDFYDVFRLDQKRLALVMGDVSGKGLDAAVFTAMCRYMLRAFAQDFADPSDVMAHLNDAMSDYTPYEMFITLFYGVLDTESQILTCASSGHEPSLFYHRKAGRTVTIDVAGRVLGIEKSSRYAQSTIKLSPEDVLLIYTDGITDARCQGKFYGIEGLERTLKSSARLDVAEIAEAVFKDATSAACGYLRDDAALLIVKAK